MIRRGLLLAKASRHVRASASKLSLSTVTEPVREKHLFWDNFGKIIGAIVGAIALAVTRSMKASGQQEFVQHKLTAYMPAEPSELNDLRHHNTLSSDELLQLAVELKRKYGDAITYNAFIAETRTILPHHEWKYGHVLDRVILADPLRGFPGPTPSPATKVTAAAGGNGSTSSSPLESLSSISTWWATKSVVDLPPPPSPHSDALFSLSFLLVALQLLVNEVAEDRVWAAHKLISIIEGEDGSSSSSSVDLESTPPPLSFTQLERVVDLLKRTCQLPVEKMVGESGLALPWKTFTVASPSQLITKGYGNVVVDEKERRKKFSIQGGVEMEEDVSKVKAFNEDLVMKLLFSRSVCAWGECYRRDARVQAVPAGGATSPTTLSTTPVTSSGNSSGEVVASSSSSAPSS